MHTSPKTGELATCAQVLQGTRRSFSTLQTNVTVTVHRWRKVKLEQPVATTAERSAERLSQWQPTLVLLRQRTASRCSKLSELRLEIPTSQNCVWNALQNMTLSCQACQESMMVHGGAPSPSNLKLESDDDY